MLQRSYVSWLAGVGILGLSTTAFSVTTGTILRIMDGIYTVNLGKADGLSVGQELGVLRNKETIGRLRVIEVREGDADATLIESKPNLTIIVGENIVALTAKPAQAPPAPSPAPPSGMPPESPSPPSSPSSPSTKPPKMRPSRPGVPKSPPAGSPKTPAHKSPMPTSPVPPGTVAEVDPYRSPYAVPPGVPLLPDEGYHSGHVELFPPGPNEERVAGTLTDLGFENVVVAPTAANGVYVEFENRRYRWEIEALGEALRAVASNSAEKGLLTVVGKMRGVPIYEVDVTLDDFRAFRDGSMPESEFRSRITALRPSSRGMSGQNHSYRRVDAVVGNSFRANLSSFADDRAPGGQVILRLGVESDLLKGVRARFRELIPLNSASNLQSNPATDVGEVSYLHKFSPQLYGLASIGQFTDVYGGIRGEFTYFPAREDALDLHFGKVGNGLSDLHTFAYQGTWRHQLPHVDAQIFARAGKFLFGDKGTGFGFRTQFRERSYEFAYTKSDIDKLLTFTLRWPYGFPKYSEPKAFRLRPDRQFRLRYTQKAAAFGAVFPDDGPMEDWQVAMLPSVLGQYLSFLKGDDEEEPSSQPSLMKSVDDIPLSSMIGTSLSGSTGLWFIPAADVEPYGYWTLGANWVHKTYRAKEPGFSGSGTMAQYFTFGALPKLEITLRLTNQSGKLGAQKYAIPGPSLSGTGYNIDREVSAQYLLFTEKGSRPSLLVGGQDFLGDLEDLSTAVVYKAYYGMLGRHFGKVGIHAGIGTDTLKGFLFGADWAVDPRIRIIGDYHRSIPTLGLRVEPLKNIRVDLYSVDFKKAGAGLSYTRRM